MREIKFREWDKITNQWSDVWSIGWKAWENGDLKGLFNYVEIWNKDTDGSVQRLPHDVDLVEFTGLRDKNGKEIYEGDILKGSGVVELGSYCMFVGARGDYNQYHTGWNTTGYEPISESDDLEVIGNIHENPELVK